MSSLALSSCSVAEASDDAPLPRGDVLLMMSCFWGGGGAPSTPLGSTANEDGGDAPPMPAASTLGDGRGAIIAGWKCMFW
jgi:hypothetical protein